MPEKTTHSPSIKDIPGSAWKKLSEKKVYFGHQSVGFNIIDGIRDVMKENPQIKLNIVETNDPSEFNTPLFAHSRVGKNTDPKSKIDAFASFVEKGIGNKANIAFFKFCFVDITNKTDIEQVFALYKSTMSDLKKRFPKTTFVHVTVPLTAKLTGINGLVKKAKDLVKKIIGRPVSTYLENINRNKFNNMIRKEYEERGPLFDIAKVESTFRDGTKQAYHRSGVTFYTLIEDYTYDIGHLNKIGSKVVAEQLLLFLARISE